MKPDHIKASIEFQNVTFQYPTRPDRTVLSNVNLSITPGTKAALVGPSGSGKSTCVSLISRFYDPAMGSVKVGGYDVKDLEGTWLRGQIGALPLFICCFLGSSLMPPLLQLNSTQRLSTVPIGLTGVVQQEPILFCSSIRDNITFGISTERLASITDEDIETAARQANAHEFIVGFSEKYDTIVGKCSFPCLIAPLSRISEMLQAREAFVSPAARSSALPLPGPC